MVHRQIDVLSVSVSEYLYISTRYLLGREKKCEPHKEYRRYHSERRKYRCAYGIWHSLLKELLSDVAESKICSGRNAKTVFDWLIDFALIGLTSQLYLFHGVKLNFTILLHWEEKFSSAFMNEVVICGMEKRFLSVLESIFVAHRWIFIVFG